MTADTDELPLLQLFTRLREAGLPLGIAEYQVLLRALQSGFGVDSATSLARVCKVIWTKAPDEQRLFDYHFQQLANELTRPSRDMDQDTESISRFPQPGIDSYALPETDTLTAPIVEPEPASLAKDEHLTPEPSPSAGLALQNNDEIQVVQALRVSSREYEARPKRFRLADEYLPITRRQMKQSWRHLRLLVREGPPTELDLVATVGQIGRLGMLLAPTMVPRRINRTRLLLLIDSRGSMGPFGLLARRLTDTAVRGGRLERTGIYYFHDCPTDYLYKDAALQEPEAVDSLLSRIGGQFAAALVFSDAGAARGGFHPERIELTDFFLDRLRRRIHHVVWLNPIPPARWIGTTAQAISRCVPMFETNRRGMDDAIDVLRGKYMSSRGST